MKWYQNLLDDRVGNNNSYWNVANKRIKMKTKETIRKILLEKPHLRDNDNKLIASFWYRELNSKNIDSEEITALNFLHKYADNELTNAESIRRMRAKLQEEEPGLRGEAYKIRKGKLQEEWRKNLGYEK